MKGMSSNDSTLGLYLSIPFCKAKCSFCNFASDAFPPAKMSAYVQKLTREIASSRSYADAHALVVPPRVDSIFLGGGTPSLLEPHQLTELFAAIRAAYPLTGDCEITVEAAPGQIAGLLLDALMLCGVTRISLGVQSFVDAESRAVGRLHTAAECHAEISRLRSAGIENINIDLIAGLPHQTYTSWAQSLDSARNAAVDHVSVYMLEVDEESRLGRELIGPGARYGAHATPSDQLVAELYTQACETLEHGGLRQYEISNFAREGFQSRHNRKYWQRDAYFGFGLDAHSMLRSQREHRAVRFANGDELDAYCAGTNSPEPEHIDLLGEWEESIFLGLRLTPGVSLSALRHSYPAAWCDDLLTRSKALQHEGLMSVNDDSVCLTHQGRIVSSSVFGELLAHQPAFA